MVDVCSPGGVEGGVCCCASRLLPPADPLAPSSPPLNLLQLQKNMALMLSRRVIKSSKNQICMFFLFLIFLFISHLQLSIISYFPSSLFLCLSFTLIINNYSFSLM